jgi:hypothetical protein
LTEAARLGSRPAGAAGGGGKPPGRPPKYPAACDYALELLEAEPETKPTALLRKCREKFPNAPLPKNAASFGRTVRNYRQNRQEKGMK